MEILIYITYLIGIFCYNYSVVTLTLNFLQRKQYYNKYYLSVLFTAISLFVFIVNDLYGISLIGNWIIITLIYYLEIRFLLKMSMDKSLFLSLKVCICTLSTMIFSRVIFALIFGKQLMFFDNVLNSLNPIKIMPTIFGYILCAIIFYYYANDKKNLPIRHLISVIKNIRMFRVIMLLTICFLILQMFLYTNIENTTISKIWSLMSCVYITTGYYISLSYAIRISKLYYMRDKNVIIEEKIKIYKEEELQLKDAIEIDKMTGVLTRHTGESKIKKLKNKTNNIILCIVDLDGLKFVNDTFGHAKGDLYIKTISNIIKNNCRINRNIICRYGGDEFLIAFVDTAKEAIEKRMKIICDEINKLEKIFNFPMYISYGTCLWDNSLEFNSVVDIADEKMYRMKYKHKIEKTIDNKRYETL